MIEVNEQNAHRLISPRVAFAVGVTGSMGPNIIPMSNVTSLSTEPELIGIGSYVGWQTTHVLREAEGFTLSVPSAEQDRLIWKLAASYSGYSGDGSGAKMEEFSEELDTTWSKYGPVLERCIGRIECRLASVLTGLGNHVWLVGQVLRAEADPSFLNHKGECVKDYQPLMQVSGNVMSTAAPFWRLDYFD